MNWDLFLHVQCTSSVFEIACIYPGLSTKWPSPPTLAHLDPNPTSHPVTASPVDPVHAGAATFCFPIKFCHCWRSRVQKKIWRKGGNFKLICLWFIEFMPRERNRFTGFEWVLLLMGFGETNSYLLVVLRNFFPESSVLSDFFPSSTVYMVFLVWMFWPTRGFFLREAESSVE